MYEYKVVPFVGQLKKGVFSIESARKVTEQLQAVITEHAKGGWEYYRMDKVNVLVKPGCLGSLFGSGVDFLTFDQVVFRRVVDRSG